MRTFTCHTKSLACWVTIGLLSACTVTVNEGDPDRNEGDAAVGESTDEESTASTGGEDAGGGASTSDDESSDPDDTIDVHLEDGGTSEPGDGGSVEGDGGVVSERFSCGSRDTEGATEVEGSIGADVTWSGTVFIKGRVDVLDDVTVTIEPGTRIIMGVDSDIEFGWNSGAVTVKADGTLARPITICGQEDDPGFWRSIIFGNNVTSNSTFKNVLVSGGGSDVAAVRFGADITVENVQVVDSSGAGIEAHDFRPDSSALSVFGAGGAAAILKSQSAVTNFPLGGVFEDNVDNHVEVDFTSIDGSSTVTFHDLGIPYLQTGAMDVLGSVVLEFEAGVVYRFTADADLEVGWNSSDPTLRIQGTEDSPVVFEGQGDEPGYWRGVIVGNNVRTNSTISHLQLRHAGGDERSALSIESPITLSDVTLEANEMGMSIDEDGLDPDSTNLSITGTEGVPLTVEPDALVTLPRGGSYTGNDDDVIAIDGTSFEASGTVYNLGVPYRVLRSIDTMGGSSMTIEPGVVFEMTADTSIEFGWNSGQATVMAVGTEDAPIVFKGVDETPGAWAGIWVNNNVTSNSEFAYVTVAHAGDSGDTESGAGIYLRGAVPVSNCTFDDIAGYGVLVSAEGNAALVVDNTVTGATLGILPL